MISRDLNDVEDAVYKSTTPLLALGFDKTRHLSLFFVASGILDHFGLRESQVQGLLHLLGNPEKVTIVPFDFDFIQKLMS